jgi:hypothetical protein
MFIFNRGRSKTAHGYPETRAGANSSNIFARNFAFGPSEEITPVIDDAPGTEIPWGTIDVPGVDIHDVPITPLSTGVIIVQGVVSLHNTSEIDIVDIQVQVKIGAGSPVVYPIPASEKVSVPVDDGEGGEGFAVLPFFVQIPGLPIGTQQIVRILLTADAENLVEIVLNSSTVEVKEVTVSTG